MNYDFENKRQTFSIPDEHVKFIKTLDINPSIIYDIGSCVFHWADKAKDIWTNGDIYAFDGNTDMKYFYEKNKGLVIKDYNLGLLSDMTRIVDYYKSSSNEHCGGNSYYPETIHRHLYSPVKQTTIKLDDVVKQKGFPKPDLVKIDVQGAEIDVLRGGKKTLRSCNHLIIELQHIQYNEGAYLCDESIKIIEEEFNFKLINPRFCDNGPDADYYFSKL